MKRDASTQTMSTEPYWWETQSQYPDTVAELPRQCEALVIGAGYTGLSAALRLVRGGSSVVVLEAGRLGHGASSRNGGMVSGVLKHSPAKLRAQYGDEACQRIFAEAQNSVPYLEALIEREGIDCAYRRSGMYFAAYTRRDFEKMEAGQAELAEVGVETDMVTPAERDRELASEYYFGGRILRQAGGLQPAELHRGLVRAAVDAGAIVCEETRALAFERVSGGWQIRTNRGPVQAENLVLATNGYTQGASTRIARRLIPIQSYVIATSPLGKENVRRLIPKGRMVQDTKNLLYYFRPSPDGTRIVFGGRASFTDIDLHESARRLMAGLRKLFPESMAEISATHSWSGKVAFTFSKLPHIGREEGMYYALGYCGQGVAMSCYLGERVASLMLSPQEPVSVFQELSFRGRVGYTGNPWMLPAVSAGLKLRDYFNRHLHL